MLEMWDRYSPGWVADTLGFVAAEKDFVADSVEVDLY